MARLPILFCFQLFLSLTLVQGKPSIVDNFTDRVLKEIQHQIKTVEETVVNGAEIINEALLPGDAMIAPLQTCQILEILNRRGDQDNSLVQQMIMDIFPLPIDEPIIEQIILAIIKEIRAIEKELNPTERQYVIDGILNTLKNQTDPKISYFANMVDGILQSIKPKIVSSFEECGAS